MSSFIVQFCLLTIFATTLKDISVASLNFHGFKASSAYLKSSIANHGGIWLGQEHWLSDQQLPQLQQIGAQFVARSGMEEAISNRIFPGRPYGGVCIAWTPDINHIVVPLTNYRHKRVIGIEVKTEENNILVLCIYMPFNDSSNRLKCMAETIDAISMLESMIEEHPQHSVILGGDFNTELKGESPFDTHWNHLMKKFKLTCCDKFYPSNSVTYRHKTLDQKKFSDHFLVSESIIESGKVSNFAILDEGDNQSDHLPIKMSLTSDFVSCSEDQNFTARPASLKWSKLNDSHKRSYTERAERRSRSRATPSLVGCLKDADSHLPRFKPGTEKDWWTDELSHLKQKSIEIHSLWVSEGRTEVVLGLPSSIYTTQPP